MRGMCLMGGAVFTTTMFGAPKLQVKFVDPRGKIVVQFENELNVRLSEPEPPIRTYPQK